MSIQGRGQLTRSVVASEVLGNRARESCLGDGSDHGVDFLTSLEHHQSWNAADAELAGHVGIFIGVELEHLDLAFELLGNFVNNGSHHATGAAPWGPEIDQHGDVALKDVLFEGGVGDSGSAGHSGSVELGEI